MFVVIQNWYKILLGGQSVIQKLSQGGATSEGSLQFRSGACLSFVDLEKLYVTMLSVFTEVMIPRITSQ